MFYDDRPPKLLRPKDPERPLRMPLIRPVEAFVRTLTRPKPLGRCFPIPERVPPTDLLENIVWRGAGA